MSVRGQVRITATYERAESFHRAAVRYRKLQALTDPLLKSIQAEMERIGVDTPITVGTPSGAITVTLNRRAEYIGHSVNLDSLRYDLGPRLNEVLHPRYFLEAAQCDGTRLPLYPPTTTTTDGESFESIVRRYDAERTVLNGAKANRKAARDLIVSDLEGHFAEPGVTTFMFTSPAPVAIRVTVRQALDRNDAMRLFPNEMRAATFERLIPERMTLSIR